MEQIILTGDRPTGRLHVGHYVGSLKRRVELQNSGKYDKIFIMIADAQALTDNAEHPEKVRQNIIEVALDYLACGLDPVKSTMFIQSQIPELCELSFYYMNLVTVARLQRNPTVKSEIQMRNFEASIPVGFFTYPISQASDITAFKATAVPVGEDQAPMLEQTKEIVRKFNAVYGDTLVEPEMLLPDNKACLRLPGIDGKAKMSKSLGNCIYLGEDADEVKKKVMSMFTDPNHLRVEDPGQVEDNPVFIYLDAFSRPEHFERHFPDYQNIEEMKAHYTRGGLGDMKVKKFLNNVLQDELEPIRNRRRELEKDIPAIYDILKEGSMRAREAAADGEVPVGAVVLAADGQVIGRGRNLRETHADPLAHAEVKAMAEAAASLDTWNLADCTLVVTLEPCPMCAGACLQTHIGRIVFGAWDAKLGACGSVWDIPRDPHVGLVPEVIGGVREAECGRLMTDFFARRR